MALSGLGRVKITERVMRVSAEMLLEGKKVKLRLGDRIAVTLTCSIESE